MEYILAIALVVCPLCLMIQNSYYDTCFEAHGRYRSGAGVTAPRPLFLYHPWHTYIIAYCQAKF